MKISSLREVIRYKWLRMVNALYHNDVSAVRAFLIGASLAWGGWLFAPGNSLELRGLRVLEEIFKNEYVLAILPLASALARLLATDTIGVLGRRARLIADAIASAWWLGLTVSLYLSSALAPGIGVYSLTTIFSLWVLWRDASPKKCPEKR